MPAFAVERHIASLGGIDDQRSLFRRRCGEPAFAQIIGRRHDDPGCCGLLVEFRRFGKGIVTTGIENDDAEFARAADGRKQAVQGECLLADLLKSPQGDIDRDQEVFARYFDAMAGIIDQRDIGCFRAEGEVVDRLDEAAERLVNRLGHIEADGFQRGGDPLRVVACVIQRHDIAIG